MKKTLLLLIAFFAAAAFANAALCESESILVISDIHLTKDAQDHEAVLQAVIQAAQGKDAVLLLGDNTNNSHSEEHGLVLRWAQEINRRTGAEVYVIPGNHDYSSGFGPEEFSARYRLYGWKQSFSRDTATAGYAVMTENGTCLLMLDTNQYDQRHAVLPYGGMEDSTIRWIQETLSSLPDGTPVLACGHHPILPRDREARTPGANALNRILRAYGVGLYLCGHDHGFAAVEEDGLRQITVGLPQSYPGWAGVVDRDEDAFLWQTVQLYDEESGIFIRLRDSADALGHEMARGTLAPTPYADDAAAVEWFASAFMLFSGNEMTAEKSALLLADENCGKWRLVETPTVVKDWIFDLLENPPGDVRRIAVPSSRKHAVIIPD